MSWDPVAGPALPHLPSASWANATLTEGPLVANSSPTFWGLALATTCPSCIQTNASIGAFLGASPFIAFRLSQDADRCNASADVQYADNGSVMGPCSLDVPAFRQWCETRPTPCVSIIDLPAENNNSAEDAEIARYVVDGVGFQPDYWAFGNEPMGWTHFGIPWANWSESDASKPTPYEYAYDVHAALAAVRMVDPAGKFIGIEAACECNWDYFEAVAKVDGANLSAIAYHTYPSTARSTTESLQQFYDPLASSTNITTSYETVRTDIAGECPGCATLPIFVTEYNAGPGWAPSNLAGSYANAVFLSVSAIQALEANVTLFAISDLQSYGTNLSGFSLMNLDGSLRPTGELFAGLLEHLALGEVDRTSVVTPVSGVWAMTSENRSVRSLLVVNANLTEGLDLDLSSLLAPGSAASLYAWSPGEKEPTMAQGALPATYKVGPQGILLIDVD